MKRSHLIVAFSLTMFGLSRAVEAAYIIHDDKGRRLTIVGTRIMMGHASTVWHGKRGGKFFAFHEGRRWYLTADRNGDVFVTDNKKNALRWDFTETKPETSKDTPTVRRYLIPRATSNISTRSLDGDFRILTVLTDQPVRDAHGRIVKQVSLVRLSPPGPQPADSPQSTTFTIKGSDSQFTTSKPQQ